MNFRKIFLNLESLIFISSQFAVGFLNYLFQVYASRTLTTVEFGSWAQWLAQFSVACFAGVWLQSLTSIGPLENWLSLKKSRLLLPVIFIALLASFQFPLSNAMFVLGWLGSILTGFWFGVHLRTKQMKLLAAATIIGHASKFLWVSIDHSAWAFYHATALAPMIIVSIFLIFSKSHRASVPSNFKISPQLLLASVSLAFFATWVPQVDLLVSPRILSEIELGIFAKVALLCKGFYFGFQVLAQLLLAHQVQSAGNRLNLRHFALLAALGVFAAGFGMAVASYFQWPSLWAPLSLLHVTTLCLMFLGIQDLAARHRGTSALALCLFSVFVATVGAFVGFSIETYWIYAICTEAIAVSVLAFQSRQNQDLTKS